MLKKIFIKNIRSINECTIDFKKGKYEFLNNMLINNQFVNPIAIYGHNGSGKTSIIYAMRYLLNALIDSPDQFFFVPNLMKKNNEEKYHISLSTIKVFFEINGNDYEYNLVARFDKIYEEKLICNKIEYINRIENKCEFRVNDEIKTLLNESNTFLSLRNLATLENNTDNIIIDAYNYLSSFACVMDCKKESSISKELVKSKEIDFLCNYNEKAKEVMADYECFPVYNIKKTENKALNIEANIVIDSGDNKYLIPYNLASSGMKSQSFLISMALSLNEGSVLFIDELDCNLHNETFEAFINFVIKRKIQLVFTAHNTSILKNIRPDQLYFTKWKDGYSSIKRLSEIYPNIREINNIEKMYLSHLFDEEK